MVKDYVLPALRSRASRYLAAAVPMLFVFAAPASAQEAQYIGHEQCKVCHNKPAEGAQWNQWKESKHSKAIEMLKTDEAKATATKIGLTTPPAESPECLKCHVTGYDPAKKAAPAKIKAVDSVQCETCHGPGSEHQKDGKVLMFEKDKAGTIDVKKHLAAVDEKTCLQCHNDTSPTWKTDRYTLPSGEKVGFDYEQAKAKITHPNPTKKDGATAKAN